ncbi:MAG: hypothetical protein WBW94_08600 [Anaerolineales bacterium]
MFPMFENLEEEFILNSEQRGNLEKAHYLISVHQFKDAAFLFQKLAYDMEESNHPKWSAIFNSQASYAFADSDFEEGALSHARTALHLFIQSGMEARSKIFYFNIIQVLANREMKIAMGTLQNEFGEKLGIVQSDLNNYLVTKHVSLPSNCPKCGAPINSTEVYWIDDNTAECNYCGSKIQTDGR